MQHTVPTENRPELNLRQLDKSLKSLAPPPEPTGKGKAAGGKKATAGKKGMSAGGNGGGKKKQSAASAPAAGGDASPMRSDGSGLDASEEVSFGQPKLSCLLASYCGARHRGVSATSIHAEIVVEFARPSGFCDTGAYKPCAHKSSAPRIATLLRVCALAGALTLATTYTHIVRNNTLVMRYMLGDGLDSCTSLTPINGK